MGARGNGRLEGIDRQMPESKKWDLYSVVIKELARAFKVWVNLYGSTVENCRALLDPKHYNTSPCSNG